MSDAFKNIRKKQVTQIGLQSKEGGVKKKKSGRPLRPNMVRKLIKVDEVLYAQIGKLAITESTSIAALIAEGLRSVLSKRNANESE